MVLRWILGNKHLTGAKSGLLAEFVISQLLDRKTRPTIRGKQSRREYRLRARTAAEAAPRELIVRLRVRWQACVEREIPRVSAYRAVFELNNVHLLGASALGCLILGRGAKAEQEVGEFWQEHGGSGRLTIILAATGARRGTPPAPVWLPNSVFSLTMRAQRYNRRSMKLAIKDAFEALVAAAPKDFQKKLTSLVDTFYASEGSEAGETTAFAPLQPTVLLGPFQGDKKAAHRVMCSAASLFAIARAGGTDFAESGLPKLWPNLATDPQGWCRWIPQSPLPAHLSHEGLVDFMAAKGYVCALADAFDFLEGDYHLKIIERKWRPTSKSGMLGGPPTVMSDIANGERKVKKCLKPQ